jgi:hypothetical protein
MRMFIGIALALSTTVAFGHDTRVGCGGEPERKGIIDPVLLTKAERDAVIRRDRQFSALVKEVLIQEAESLDEDLPRLSGAKDISWEEAKRLVLLGVINTTIQAHNLTVHLVSDSGAVYRTKEPKIDEIWRISQVVDPCRRFIQHITESLLADGQRTNGLSFSRGRRARSIRSVANHCFSERGGGI